MGSRSAVVLWLVSIAIGIAVFTLINDQVPDPYLDEIFHIPQTFQYCRGNFRQWDPKITTPPGLYVFGFAWAKLLNQDCNVGVLRSVNFVGGHILLPFLLGIMSGNGTYGIVLSNVPIVWFFSNLYYTDVWSTILIFGSMVTNQLSPWLGAFLAAVSLAFRQTNIVWAVFSAGYLVIQRQRNSANGVQKDEASSLVQQIYELVLTACTTSLDAVFSYGLVGLLFGVFIYYNEGITMGDKENHAVGLHGAQILYFSLFTVFLSWPAWASRLLIDRYLKRLTTQWYLVAFEIAAIVIVIEKFTIVHPFILADNRHYTFYLWRRLIQPSWSLYAKYLLVPVYHFGTWNILSSLTRSVSIITTLLFVGCTLATLVPSPLFEPRYYIVPYLLWRTLVIKSLPRVCKYRITIEAVWNLAINSITAYVFIYKPFEWSHEPGVLQRFMW
jgi:alpha-1,2-glucosyltransferase